MNEPITITDAAREAAHREQLFRSDEIRGHYVQLAINAATEQLRSDLATTTKEMDAERLSAERWKAAAQINDSNHQLVLATLQSDSAASQQTVAALREALETAKAMLQTANDQGKEFAEFGKWSEETWSKHQLMTSRAVKKVTAALSATPAPALVSRDTERLDWLEKDGSLQLLYTQVRIKLKQWEPATWDIRAAIDAELDRTKGAE